MYAAQSEWQQEPEEAIDLLDMNDDEEVNVLDMGRQQARHVQVGLCRSWSLRVYLSVCLSVCLY